MVGAVVRCHKVKAVRLGAARVVGGKLQALYLDGVIDGVLADLLRRGAGTVGQDVAEAFAVGDLADELEDIFIAAVNKLHAAGVFLGDDAALVKLVGKADGRGDGDGVEPEPVAEVCRRR